MRKRKLGRRTLHAEHLETRVLLAGDVANMGAMLEARVASLFESLDGSNDSEPDGVITAGEVSQRAWSRLSAADVDESGGVSQEELIAHIRDKVGNGAGGMGHNGRGHWQGLRGGHGRDRGGGRPGHEEFDPEVLAERIGAVVDRIFAAKDGSDGSDSNGALTESEVSDRQWKRLSTADGADGTEADGVVTRDELVAHLSARVSEKHDDHDVDDHDETTDDGEFDGDDTDGDNTEGSETDSGGTDVDDADGGDTEGGKTDGEADGGETDETDGSENNGRETEPVAAAAQAKDDAAVNGHSKNIPQFGRRISGLRGRVDFRGIRGFRAN